MLVYTPSIYHAMSIAMKTHKPGAAPACLDPSPVPCPAGRRMGPLVTARFIVIGIQTLGCRKPNISLGVEAIASYSPQEIRKREMRGLYLKGHTIPNLDCNETNIQLFPCCRDLNFQDISKITSHGVLPFPNSSLERQMSSVGRNAHET